MTKTKTRHLLFIAVLISALVLSTVLAACSSSNSSQSASTPTPHPVACAQPQPAPGNLTLAGIGYGPYHSGQDPNVNVFPSSQEVTADMPTLAALTRYIRIYSSLGSANDIIQAAGKNQICVALGIWLGKDATTNAKEITAGEQLAASRDTVHSVIVGNEVLLRRDLSEEQLHEAIQQVRTKLGHSVQISMADDYNQWLAHPDLAKDVDFITVHIYPFWQKVSIDGAMQALKQAYQRVVDAFPGKQIVIGETGWPSAGPSQGDAVPSEANQARYFQEFVSWAQQQNIRYFYFDAFDEAWKVNESGVGTHWGLYQENGVVKPELSHVLPNAAPETLKERSYLDVFVGGLEEGFGLGIDTSNQQRNWLTVNGPSLKLDYPANQAWGTMFITVGPPVPPGNRPSIDLSTYKSLVVNIRTRNIDPDIEFLTLHN